MGLRRPRLPVPTLFWLRERSVAASSPGDNPPKLLSTEVGLSEAWHQARFRKAQESHRQAWQAVITNNPNLGVNAVRVLEPAAFMWLYRHNREWLTEESAKLSKAPRQNHSNVN